MVLTEAHRNKLRLRYGINSDDPYVKNLIESGYLRSIISTEELQLLLLRTDVEGSGIYVGYPNDYGSFTLRLDEPLQRDGKIKYLRRSQEPNHLFVPLGLHLDKVEKLMITEGEIKSLSGYLHGLPVIAVSGIWNWRTIGPDLELLPNGQKLSDTEALISELDRDWTGKSIALVYDSDITIGHPGYPAFERLAEQLYRLGAIDVRIVTLPSVENDGKTGIDDFILAKGADGPEEIKKIIDRTEPYVPLADGAEVYAKRLITSDNPQDKLRATMAYLADKREYSTRLWLERHVPRARDRDALIKDARSELIAIRRERRATRRPLAFQINDIENLYDLPHTLLQGTNYSINQLGSLCRVELRNNEGGESIDLRPLCNLVPYPTRQLRKDDGVQTQRFFEIAAIFPDGSEPAPAIISMESFASSNWMLGSWGARASLEPGYTNKDLVRHALQQMTRPELVLEETVYTHIGWRKVDGSWIYLHASGSIGGLAQVEISEKFLRYSLPNRIENLHEAIKASLDLLRIAPYEVSVPLLSEVYLAPLCESLRIAEIEPGFLLWMIGIRICKSQRIS